MFGKKFLIAAVSYVAGSVIATVFNAKKWEKVKADLEKAKKDGKSTKDILVSNFIDTHKNFLEDLKQKFLTEENKQKFNKQLDKAKDLVKDYKKQGEKLVEELKEKWVDYIEEWKEKLEKLYEEKKSDLEELVSKAPEKFEETKENLKEKFEEVKEKIKK